MTTNKHSVICDFIIRIIRMVYLKNIEKPKRKKKKQTYTLNHKGGNLKQFPSKIISRKITDKSNNFLRKLIIKLIKKNSNKHHKHNIKVRIYNQQKIKGKFGAETNFKIHKGTTLKKGYIYHDENFAKNIKIIILTP